MIADVAAAFGLGVGLGVVTGLPLGVVNVAVVATAARHGGRPGAAIGLGGALADGTHAAIAFAGLGPLVARAAWSDALTLASGLVLLAFAWRIARARPGPDGARAIDRRSGPRRVAAGLALTLPNPAALAAWIAVATALGPRAPVAAAAAAIGVALGSMAYFAGLAHLAARSARTLARPRWIDRGAALALAAVGVAAIVRAIAGWLR